MNLIRVYPSLLKGTLPAPPSKSHTLRALWLASMAKGESCIDRYLDSPDTQAMIATCQAFGADVIQNSTVLRVRGVGGLPSPPSSPIDCGNSGQVLRYAAVQAALLETPCLITGDDSIQNNRPMHTLVNAWKSVGVCSYYQGKKGFAPLQIHGPAHAGKIEIDGQFAQPITASLFLALSLPGKTEIKIHHLQEPAWVTLTLYWLDKLRLRYIQYSPEHYEIVGKQTIPPFSVKIPGDFSSIAFLVSAALITGSTLEITHVDLHDPQGDKIFLKVVEMMGGQLHYDEKKHILMVLPSQLKGGEFCIRDHNDSIAALTLLSCFAASPSCITGIENTRYKESNRPQALVEEFRKLGANITPYTDKLFIEPTPLKPNITHSHHDHRIAMALILAGLAIQETAQPFIVRDAEIIAKSFPGFVTQMQKIGAGLKEG